MFESLLVQRLGMGLFVAVDPLLADLGYHERGAGTCVELSGLPISIGCLIQIESEKLPPLWFIADQTSKVSSSQAFARWARPG